MTSLKFDKDGFYVSVKAVFSDGVIRLVYLNKRQKNGPLYGEAVVSGYYWVQGWVDMHPEVKRYTNAGFMFWPKPTDANCHMLPNWNIPGWSMPIRSADIR
jgi:hypothetical protein